MYLYKIGAKPATLTPAPVFRHICSLFYTNVLQLFHYLLEYQFICILCKNLFVFVETKTVSTNQNLLFLCDYSTLDQLFIHMMCIKFKGRICRYITSHIEHIKLFLFYRCFIQYIKTNIWISFIWQNIKKKKSLFNACYGKIMI